MESVPKSPKDSGLLSTLVCPDFMANQPTPPATYPRKKGLILGLKGNQWLTSHKDW